jgi:hypothetical protein
LGLDEFGSKLKGLEIKAELSSKGIVAAAANPHVRQQSGAANVTRGM